MKSVKLILIAIVLMIVTLGYGQILEPVKWTFSKKSLSKDVYELTFKASIEYPWHMYSQNIEMQPPATLFIFEKNDNMELIGNVIEKSEVINVFDENFGIDVNYFENEAIFIQKIKIKSKQEIKLEGYLEYMACNDEMCTPPTEEDFEFVFNAK